MSSRRAVAPEITITVADSAWRRHPQIPSRIRAAIRFALRRAKASPKSALTILLTSNDSIREMNARYRGKDNPTNVLSFPAEATPGYLGDVAIAYGVTREEASKTGKSLGDHTVHLAVHGALHLLGYDHEAARDAAKMEALEIEILAELGIRNPYEIDGRPVA